MAAIELQAQPYVSFELRGICIHPDTPQRGKVEPGVKVIDPLLGCGFAICPGAIRTLLRRRIPCGFERRSQESLLAGMPVDSAENFGRQKVCVVDLAPHRRQWIRESCRAVRTVP